MGEAEQNYLIQYRKHRQALGTGSPDHVRHSLWNWLYTRSRPCSRHFTAWRQLTYCAFQHRWRQSSQQYGWHCFQCDCRELDIRTDCSHDSENEHVEDKPSVPFGGERDEKAVPTGSRSKGRVIARTYDSGTDPLLVCWIRIDPGWSYARIGRRIRVLHSASGRSDNGANASWTQGEPRDDSLVETFYTSQLSMNHVSTKTTSGKLRIHGK